ncbi:MAG: hypothetical protein ACRCUT_10280 [Spirochaetota bacterium]
MKKVTVMMALFAFVAGFVACGSGGIGGQVKGESFKTEGWMDNDTYRTTATGVSKEGLKNKVQRRGTAREAAVLVAQSHVIEKFKGAKVEGATGVSDYASTGFAASKEFAGIVKGGSVIKETYDEEDNCEVVYEIKSKGLKKQLTGAVVE